MVKISKIKLQGFIFETSRRTMFLICACLVHCHHSHGWDIIGHFYAITLCTLHTNGTISPPPRCYWARWSLHSVQWKLFTQRVFYISSGHTHLAVCVCVCVPVCTNMIVHSHTCMSVCLYSHFLLTMRDLPFPRNIWILIWVKTGPCENQIDYLGAMQFGTLHLKEMKMFTWS